QGDLVGEAGIALDHPVGSRTSTPTESERGGPATRRVYANGRNSFPTRPRSTQAATRLVHLLAPIGARLLTNTPLSTCGTGEARASVGRTIYPHGYLEGAENGCGSGR